MPLVLSKYGILWYIRLYKRLLVSSNGIILFEADIWVFINSDPVVGKLIPLGVIPRNASYKSLVLKLLEYNLTPKSLIASATKSLDIP